MTREFDTPWKEAFDEDLEDFVEFAFPDIHVDVDWPRGYIALDTELPKIIRDSELGQALADRLYSVWLKDGTEAWVLIHLEAQAQRDNGLPRRMFVYNYRIFDRYDGRKAVSLAILLDDSKKWHPKEFVQELWGSGHHFKFRTLKMLDWKARLPELEAMKGPIALIVRAHLTSLSTHKKPTERYNAKWILIRTLLEGGLKPEKIRRIYKIIDWMLELPKELGQKLDQDILVYEEEKKMPWLSSMERNATERGEKFGEQKGLEKGLAKGRVGVLMPLRNILRKRYDSEGIAFADVLENQMDVEVLARILNGAIEELPLEELRQMATEHAVASSDATL